MEYTVKPVDAFRGEIKNVPPDKSIAHRAAMFAALASGVSKIKNYPAAADPESTLECLQNLGVKINKSGNQLTVQGVGRTGWKILKNELDCGNSGTTMRLLSGILAGAGLNVKLTGDESLKSRPMKRIMEPLLEMGAEIHASSGRYAPLEFIGTKKLRGITYRLPVASAQVKSCVLLAGLFAEGETRVIESLPSRDHTERMLGLETIHQPDGTTIIKSSKDVNIAPLDFAIPGDISGSAFWLVAGTITPESRITLKNVGINPTRSAIISILKRMGAQIHVEDVTSENGEPVADITVHSSALRAINPGKHEIPNCIDEIPVLAVAMAFAKGTSTIKNAEELRTKETDRINAVVTMLKKSGVHIEEFEDGFSIKGNHDFIPEPAEYDSFHDHRIAMASAILASRSKKPSLITRSEAASISYPDFWSHFETLAGF